MRIALICSGLEPGCNGVGDYSRGLALELAGMGHVAMVVSLNDRHAGDYIEEEEKGAGGEINTFRCPSSVPWRLRINQVRRRLSMLRPDWISLQFVCYGFHRKGLLHSVGRYIKRVVSAAPVEIMFHELWIGEEQGAPGRQRVIGFMQRFCVERFIRVVRPLVVHTSNEAYRALLKHRGIDSELLPMFGSVPVNGAHETAWLERELRLVMGGPFDRGRLLICGMFGALHSVWPPDPLLTRLHGVSSIQGKQMVMASIGRIGDGSRLWEQMRQQYGDRIHFLRLGEQSSERISEFLQFIDYGIATTPRQLIGKSSTVAAMLEHGVPVIVNREDAHFRIPVPEDSDPLLLRCDEQLESRLKDPMRGQATSRREGTARKFVADLLQAAPTMNGREK